MTKTIEEAARDFVANYYQLEEYGDEVSDIEIDNSEECFIGGANYVLSLPLSQRLTDEERERVRDAYNEAVEICKNADPMGSRFAFWDARKELLESIFGKEFFREGEV